MQKWTRALYQPCLPLGKDGKRVTGSDEHIRLSKEAAKEGMVLLKNERGLLPLKTGTRVALFGKATFDYVKGGGGSGDVTVAYTRNLYEGIKMQQDIISVYEPLCDYYRENVKNQYEAGCAPGMTAEPEVPEDLLNSARAFTDTAVISICRFSGEGWDRKLVFDENDSEISAYEKHMAQITDGLFKDSDFYLSESETVMVNAVKGKFSNIIVVMNVGGMVDSSWFCRDDKISSVLMAWQGGMEGGLAAAELLVGKGNPSGKLSDTFAADLDDYPSTAGFHESRNFVDYTEDIYVGYRYFETIPGAAAKVNYPFGFGLSYTTFDIEVKGASEKKSADAAAGDIKIRITAEVTNTGDADGKEVVQVYFGAPQGKLGKPQKQLIAFKKTRLLKPGERQTLYFEFPVRDMASYDDLGKVQKSAYVLERGEYVFYLGNSVRDSRKLDFTFIAGEDMITEQESSRLVPSGLKKRMLSDGSFEELPSGPAPDKDESVLKPMDLSETDGLTPVARRQESRKMWSEMSSDKHMLSEVTEGKITIDEFLSQLTDEELAELLGGQPNTGVANTFGYGNLPEYGVPSVMTADGPAGLRINPECGVTTTSWPCATLLACSWDVNLTEMVGAAGGTEVKENNISVWLTPAVNIHRSPLCGRNFEYYSEDPYLAGKMAAGMVRGIQSNHVGAAVKHFACNNKEGNRRESDSRVSERAAREIYLRVFEIVIKESDPWALMTSYNLINGRRSSENADLLNGILRGEWGYEGCVTTDWWNSAEHYKEVKAGNDVKMGLGFPERLMEAVKLGVLSRKEMETCARHILGLILKVD